MYTFLLDRTRFHRAQLAPSAGRRPAAKHEGALEGIFGGGLEDILEYVWEVSGG